MTSMHNEANEPAVSSSRLWFGLAAGPVLWAIHLAVAYGLSSLACQYGFLTGSSLIGFNALTLVLVILTIIPTALIAYSGVAAYKVWRTLRDEQSSGIGQPEEQRQKFMAFLGITMAVLFGAATVIGLFPIL